MYNGQKNNISKTPIIHWTVYKKHDHLLQY